MRDIKFVGRGGYSHRPPRPFSPTSYRDVGKPWWAKFTREMLVALVARRKS